MTTDPDVVLETSQLTRRYGTFTAVDRLDVRVNRGTIFGLLGPNGAGKSTTIKMLTTLLAPSDGTATVAGFDVNRDPFQVRRRIGYVSQMLSADGALTGRENLALSTKLYHLPVAERAPRIAEALAFMELADVGDKPVKEYSGGMIRRLELAQAMIHHPVVLFLDEPTIGLDPVARRLVWDRLLDLRREYGTSVLLTTHDMEEADHLCDALAIMLDGRIAAQGTPAALKASVGPDATLDDVFVRYGGRSLAEGGSFRDTRLSRASTRRRG